jgi:hypothetical protein
MLRGLPRLPETAAELRAVAKNLGAPESSIHLRQDASETTVKRMTLSEYRVVYFATHGLVAGDIKGLAEPSLALRHGYRAPGVKCGNVGMLHGGARSADHRGKVL